MLRQDHGKHGRQETSSKILYRTKQASVAMDDIYNSEYHEWHEMEEVVCKVVCRENSTSVQAEASQIACPKFASEMCSRPNSCAIS